MTSEAGHYLYFLDVFFAHRLWDNLLHLLTPQDKGRDVSEPGAWLVPAPRAGPCAFQHHRAGVETAAALFGKPLSPWAI